MIALQCPLEIVAIRNSLELLLRFVLGRKALFEKSFVCGARRLVSS
jgi:hypothetical protein